MSGPVALVRRMLLLIPAAWKAGPEGLALDRAVKLTGARSDRELEELVTAVGAFELGPSMPEDFLAVSVVNGRVVVDRALHLVTPPSFSLREGAALVAALRPFEDGGGKAVASSLRKLRKAVPEPFRKQADDLARAMDFQVNPPGEWADTLAEAIDRRLELAVEYRAEGTGTAGRRTLEPRAVFHQDGHWYSPPGTWRRARSTCSGWTASPRPSSALACSVSTRVRRSSATERSTSTFSPAASAT